MYFKSRSKARLIAKGKRKVIDNGPNAPVGRRWAVKIFA